MTDFASRTSETTRFESQRFTDFPSIHDMAIKAGILDKPINMADLIDRSFIPTEIHAATIDLSDLP